MIERTEIILLTAGHFLTRTNSWDDWILEIDNTLIHYNQPPTTTDDREMLTRAYEEAWAMFKSIHTNRKDFRQMVANEKKFRII